jgi:hypothetical protein
MIVDLDVGVMDRYELLLTAINVESPRSAPVGDVNTGDRLWHVLGLA